MNITGACEVKASLISAISQCAEGRRQRKARRFLQGLSTDELQYIADYLGARLLECPARAARSRCELAENITEFERVRSAPACRPGNHVHKMILLLEYLCCSQFYSPASLSSRIQMLR